MPAHPLFRYGKARHPKLYEWFERIPTAEDLAREELRTNTEGSPNTIITGQQPGLGGGPLFTLYKALSTVSIKKLLSKHESAKTIFWLASEDTDIGEANRFSVMLKDGQWENLPILNPPLARTMLQNTTLPRHTWDLWYESVRKALGGGDELFSIPGSFWDRVKQPNPSSELSSFADAFHGLMAPLFDPLSIQILDPTPLSQKYPDIALWSIENHDEISAVLEKTRHRFHKEGWPAPPLSPQDHLHIFHLEDGKRYRLYKQGSSLVRSRDGKEKRWPINSYISGIKDGSIRWGPNVLTRPLLQDRHFQTSVYVAGPTEYIYHAQIQDLYRSLGQKPPIIWPRPSITLLEPQTIRAARRLNLLPQDPSHGLHELHGDTLLNILNHASLAPMDEQNKRKDGHESFPGIYKTIESEIEKFPKEHQTSLSSAFMRVKKAMDVYSQKKQKIIEEINGSAQRNERKLREALFPRTIPQERGYYIMATILRYGSDWIFDLEKNMDPLFDGHHIFSLER